MNIHYKALRTAVAKALLLYSFMGFIFLSPESSWSQANSPDTSKMNSLNVQVIELQDQFDQADENQKSAKKDELLGVLEQRKKVLLELMEANPGKILEIALPDEVVAKLPTEAQDSVERHMSAKGILNRLQACDLQNGKSQEFYDLETSDSQRIKLHFTGKGPNVLSGSQVIVRGVGVGSDLALDSSNSGSVEVLAEATTPTTIKKVAVILFNFRNNPVQPYTKEFARSITYNSVDSFYQEETFGKWGIQGKLSVEGEVDVYGWYTIDYDSGTTVDYNGWATAARAAAAADGFSTTGYTQVIHAFPQNSAVSWWGLGNLGGSPGFAWVNGSYALRVVGHELGHNFGVHHSNSYNCVDSTGQRVSISSSGTSVEYGDPYDIMGNPGVVAHHNAFQKGRLGVLPSNIIDVTSDGVYTVGAIEYVSALPQVLRIPRDVDSSGNVSRYLYVEFRQPYGFDNTSNIINYASKGVLIHLAPALTTLTQTLLLDATPATATFVDAALVEGQTMTDVEKGISITTTSASSSGATVQVHYTPPPPIYRNPTISISPANQYGYPGQSMTYNVTVVNNNANAPAAMFNVASSLPAGWTQTPYSLTMTLNSGASSTQSVTITPPVGTVPNAYSFTETATNAGDNLYAASATATYTVKPPDTTAPTVAISNPANGATVSGRVTISATATDNIGVTAVEFYVDGVLKSTDSQAAYSYVWDTRKASSGLHTIMVKAYDAASNSSSVQVSVTVGSSGGGGKGGGKPR
jgi:hypothetical protein